MMSTITAVMIHITRISDFSLFIHSAAASIPPELVVDCYSSAHHCRNLVVSAYVSLTVQIASRDTVQLVRRDE